MEPVLLAALSVLFFFSFWNGFTDAANAIATVVATRVLTPIKAVALSAAGNFVGMFFFPTAVAVTMGEGIIRSSLVTAEILIAALIGGLAWDVLTWWFGLPTSESHVLVGSMIGVGVAAAGTDAINVSTILSKVVIPMVTSPTIAFIFAFFFTAAVMRLSLKSSPMKVNRYFSHIQLASSFFFSVTHGTNDAQKVMGLITAMFITYGYLSTFHVPLWVAFACHATISLGTLFGGWRIVHTMAHKITRLRPYQGACAETAAAVVLATTAVAGAPVSTTHAISGSIMGVGATRRFTAVRWGVAKSIVVAWILTIPLSAFFSYITCRVFMLAEIIVY
ncbi:inorganic phosphate transporter [Candidatus Bathyarchaeota archaeon]|nr:inorganic phosphate transporter [Candidatus Bathyarchaeota archaeon]